MPLPFADPALPLVFGVPGGPELLVVLLVSLLLFSPLLALVYLVLFREQVNDDTDERVADLEAEVAELRERLAEREEERQDVGGTGGTERDDAGSGDE